MGKEKGREGEGMGRGGNGERRVVELSFYVTCTTHYTVHLSHGRPGTGQVTTVRYTSHGTVSTVMEP